MAKIGNYDPYLHSPLDAVKGEHAPILLIHGEEDKHIPPHHSVALYNAAPNVTTLHLVENRNHFTLFQKISIYETIAKWIDRRQ